MLAGLDDIIPTFIEVVSGRVEDRYGRTVKKPVKHKPVEKSE